MKKFLIFLIFCSVFQLVKLSAQETKQVIAVQALFIEEELIDSIWQQVLKLDNVDCAATLGARPHMTIASFKLSPKEIGIIQNIFKEADGYFPSHEFKVKLYSHQRDSSRIVYSIIPSVIDTVLTEIHDTLYQYVDRGFERYRKIDIPGSWKPHVSMFSLPNSSAKFPKSIIKEINNIETLKLKGFALVSFGPIDYKLEIRTKNN